MIAVEFGHTSPLQREQADWQEPGQCEPYRIEILTVEDEEGGFSTFALNLPGAGSCGQTMDESISNAKEAIRGVLATYKEFGDSIPWTPVTSDMIEDGEYKVIWIHA